jgi:hypothetical protein
MAQFDYSLAYAKMGLSMWAHVILGVGGREGVGGGSGGRFWWEGAFAMLRRALTGEFT